MSALQGNLSSEDYLRLRMSVSEFRSSGRRLIGELFVMTQQLCVMRDILGDRFRAFVEVELGLSPRMISRYMHMNKVLNTHFTVDGRVDLKQTRLRNVHWRYCPLPPTPKLSRNCASWP